MNEEEKKIINDLKYKINEPLKANENYVDTFILVNIKECKQLVNLIDKQQKENEKLKDEYKREVFEHQEFVEDTKVAVQDYIKKDEIKEKIKELESHIWKDGYMTKFDKYAIYYLKELLGE